MSSPLRPVTLSSSPLIPTRRAREPESDEEYARRARMDFEELFEEDNAQPFGDIVTLDEENDSGYESEQLINP